MIRKAQLKDIPAIVELAVESVSINPFPVKIDRQRMADQAKECLNPAHFLYVAEIDGVVVAAVAACVMPSFWYDKLSCSVLLHYSRKPGQWVMLMREFARWVKSRSGIKTAVLELEAESDSRIVQFMVNLGFTRVSQNVSYVRNA